MCVEFPYKFRGEQRRMVEDIENVLESGGHIVINAPTGFGKTICALYPAVKYAISHGKKVLYLVRTNSQEHKVVEEAQKMGVKIAPLQGRNKMCPLVHGDEELKRGDPEELYLLCTKLRKAVEKGDEDACIYYANYLKKRAMIKIENPIVAEEIYDIAVRNGICPYEVLKDLVESSVVVVAPYIYFFVPFIRNMLLERMKVSPRDIILIVDEAHNLPDFARELRSDSLSMESINRMERECVEHGNPLILNNTCSDVAEFLKESIYRLADMDEEEGLVAEYLWEEELAELLGIGINSIKRLAMNLIEIGTMIREKKAEKRKLPRSYIYHAGTFMYLWQESYRYEFLHIVKRADNPSLEIYCLDPSDSTEIMRNVYASISMSGTLDTEIYKNLVNLPDNTVMRKYPSPFPAENLRVVYLEDVTTKYEEVDENIPKIARYIDEIASIGRNTLVLFPSYNVMGKVLSHLKTDGIVDDRNMKQKILFERIESFRKEGGTIFSVFGGRISEGMDFPGEELEIVVIAGIPYPKPTSKIKMLEKYYDYKFGNGWEYAFRNPAKIKMLQAIGRLIRTPTDRGIVIILDKRAVSFPEINAIRINDVKEELEKFFVKEKGEEGHHRDM